jgi:hypothetical protein
VYKERFGRKTCGSASRSPSVFSTQSPSPTQCRTASTSPTGTRSFSDSTTATACGTASRSASVSASASACGTPTRSASVSATQSVSPALPHVLHFTNEQPLLFRHRVAVNFPHGVKMPLCDHHGNHVALL